MDETMRGEPFIDSKPYPDHYFRWLSEDMSLYKGQEHWAMLHQLYCKPFYWINEGDAKLAEDALEFRAFYQSIWKSKLPEDMPVNCLEIIRYLAMRLSNMISDNSEKEWFWELLHNLNLDRFSDYRFYKEGGSSVINYRLAVWLTRRYKPNGHGGIFPISIMRFFLNGHHTNEDQTKISIYEQSIAYVRTQYCLLACEDSERARYSCYQYDIDEEDWEWISEK